MGTELLTGHAPDPESAPLFGPWDFLPFESFMGCNVSSLGLRPISFSSQNSGKFGCWHKLYRSASYRNEEEGRSTSEFLCAEQERRLQRANLIGPALRGFDSDEEDHEDDGFDFFEGDHFRVSICREKRGHFILGLSSPQVRLKTSSNDVALIPGLPDDLAQLCLMRIPFIKYEPSYRLVSRAWMKTLSSQVFYDSRKALNLGQAHICFVVHGNRVKIFNLETCTWCCLPPLPRERNISSPEVHVDPYDWWQIDTVAVLNGTLFVLGGDHTEMHVVEPRTKPSSSVHYYSYCRNCWVEVASMAVCRSHSAAIPLDKQIYVVGGGRGSTDGASAEIYDPMVDAWNSISSMHTSMGVCIGLEHQGKLYVKGENLGPGSPIGGQVYDPQTNSWFKMMPGMKAGLARGPVCSANSCIYVADWKDFELKVYDFSVDAWETLGELPAKISRLVSYGKTLYGFTGKIKVDSYNHRIISDAPAEVWRLDMGRGKMSSAATRLGRSPEAYGSKNCLYPNSSTAMHLDIEAYTGRPVQSYCNSIELEEAFKGQYMMTSKKLGLVWECMWRDPKQVTKIGGHTWAPCIAHCALLED